MQIPSPTKFPLSSKTGILPLPSEVNVICFISTPALIIWAKPSLALNSPGSKYLGSLLVVKSINPPFLAYSIPTLNNLSLLLIWVGITCVAGIYVSSIILNK